MQISPLQISLLPTIVSPILEPDEALPVSPSLNPEPPVPGQPDPAPTFESRFIPLREADERPTIDLFPSYMISPAQSYYDPATSLVTLDIQDVSECLSPESPATMDQYLAEDGTCCWEMRRSCPCCLCRCCRFRSPMFRFQSLPRFPLRVVSPDRSREGPFNAGPTASGSGTAPHVLDNLLGCQYRMTS